MTGFTELCITTNFSFLRGASHPEELAFQAEALDLAGFAIADRNTVAGVVRAHLAAKETKVPYAPGCRLVFCEGSPDLFVWPKDREAYGRLTRLLTVGNLRAPKGECHLALDDFLHFGEGMALALDPSNRSLKSLSPAIKKIRTAFPGALRLIAHMGYGGSDKRRLTALSALARQEKTPLLASSLPLYHAHERRILQDVVTCIREHKTLITAGRLLEKNAERHLKSEENMRWLFRDYPEAVDETARLFKQLNFSLDELKYNYPEEDIGSSKTPQEELERLTWEGTKNRFPDGLPDGVEKTINHELKLIAELEYAPYFLTVYDIVRFARDKEILCQGRGSAANSAVCFCLGITEVDPRRADLLFERFISPERREPPDIDVDFEHERREEVIQYIYEKYGRDRAGLAATVITYRSRSAVREVGKVFGLSEDAVGALSGTVWGSSNKPTDKKHIREAGLNPEEKTLATVVSLTGELIGFPRHLSQHVGGFVITRDRLDDVVPIQNAAMEDRTVIEWDKDDLNALGLLKIDVLGLGMLSCIRKALDYLKTHYGVAHSIASIPAEEKNVYDMICRADTIGVFQIESRAQMSMLPRLRPNNFYDLVIEVAIVRPGPIQGDMVHPYLRRRQGLEKVSYPKEELRTVLGKTLGIPLFQEQAMKIAIVAAGFSPAEADRLRRAMATFRRVGTIGTFEKKMIDGMVSNGYEKDFAQRCFRQIEGFGDYGFPESHAASFALLVYASCWLKCYYPDVFCAAILNSQPMGFYSSSQLIRDAREHGVEVRPIDINMSDWDTLLEPGLEASRHLHKRHSEMREVICTHRAVRLGFRQVKGLREDDMAQLVAARGKGYDSVRDLWLRSALSRSVIERLAEADAFRSLGLDRRDALWAAQGLEQGKAAERLPLFDVAHLTDLRKEPDFDLPPMPLGEHVANDYHFLRLSLKAHPVSFVRAELDEKRTRRTEELATLRSGCWVEVAGLVLVRQRPGSAKGVIFMTIEDETGVANGIIWSKVFERFRPLVLGARFVRLSGRLQNESGVIHVIVERLEDLTPTLETLSVGVPQIETLAHSDEVKHPVIELSEKNKPPNRTVKPAKEEPELIRDYAESVEAVHKLLPKGRNFH
ncbi:MAG: error-prone DNA polymerase [Stappiaceae bacterium]